MLAVTLARAAVKESAIDLEVLALVHLAAVFSFSSLSYHV